ncbi:hypothetical protein BDV26DRAFT_543 [Aspergillus bertholletiae]|uniref:Uncharacterized protein n=1 Tax=Aspergillus bertholletiae TaxID=1226010 RepID=A0A5N7BPK2_9EURO|nr:hypothetical protein BDV26DRAFT_543 [Aspergillus bertholletiae]
MHLKKGGLRYRPSQIRVSILLGMYITSVQAAFVRFSDTQRDIWHGESLTTLLSDNRAFRERTLFDACGISKQHQLFLPFCSNGRDVQMSTYLRSIARQPRPIFYWDLHNF